MFLRIYHPNIFSLFNIFKWVHFFQIMEPTGPHHGHRFYGTRPARAKLSYTTHHGDQAEVATFSITRGKRSLALVRCWLTRECFWESVEDAAPEFAGVCERRGQVRLKDEYTSRQASHLLVGKPPKVVENNSIFLKIIL